MKVSFEKMGCKSSYHTEDKKHILINDKIRNKRLFCYLLRQEMLIMGYKPKKVCKEMKKYSDEHMLKCESDISKIVANAN